MSEEEAVQETQQEDAEADAGTKSETEGRNLVVCCDGTGNQFGLHNTNVVKLYQILVKDDRQIVYYDPGVGTFSRPGYKTGIGRTLSKGLGLAFGDGFYDNLGEAYQFLVENYREGDRIFCFGFSRGAFTIRALAGLIMVCGLTDSHLENLSDYAIGLYKEGKVRGDDRSGWEFGNTFGKRPKIHCLGLWDTVSSLGFLWSRSVLPYTDINHRPRHVRHALALDERRAYFTHDPWGEVTGTFKNVEQDVREVWFAGVHSDVGGGYPEPESGLAKVALEWMVAEASQLGLLVNRTEYLEIVQALTPKTQSRSKKFVPPDALGPRHTSLSGGWWVGEMLPKNFAGEGWKKFTMPLARRRKVENDKTDREILVHASVLERMNAAEETVIRGKKARTAKAYAPSNLPAEHTTVETGEVKFEDGSTWSAKESNAESAAASSAASNEASSEAQPDDSARPA